MTQAVYVAGAGLTAFRKPASVLDLDYPAMVHEAGTKALADAGLGIGDVDAAYAAYVLGDSCSGHRAVYGLGTTGMPIFNVNSNCSSGSSALNLALQAIRSGTAGSVLCVGFEKMSGTVAVMADRSYPCGPHIEAATKEHPLVAGMNWSPQVFANAGIEHNERFGSTPKHFAKVAEKNRRHALANPYAQFHDELSLADVLASPKIYKDLTRLECSAPSTGAAAVVVMSGDEVRRRGLRAQAVEIAGQGVATDAADSFEPPSAIMAVGSSMTRRAAAQAYARSGLTIEDVDVIELHDCFSPNEILTYEALGLAPEGRGHLLVEDDATTFGGKVVVNPSGGLLGKGHPLGATGLAQCAELAWQLRGQAGDRQVDGASVALQHNLGLGGTAVVTVYRAPATSRS